MHENDTYGEITSRELADLRSHALRCDTCGMLATVDPAFHASRYGHQPRVHHPDSSGRGARFQWDSNRHEWIQEN